MTNTIATTNNNNNSSSKSNNQDLLDLLGGLDLSAPPTTTIKPPQGQQPTPVMTSPLDSLVGLGGFTTNDSDKIDASQLLVNNLLGQNNVGGQPSSASVSNDILDDFTNFNQEVGCT